MSGSGTKRTSGDVCYLVAKGGIADVAPKALEMANDFLNQGFPFVTIVGDGRVYTAQEFALTIINGGDSDTWREQIEEAISG